MKCQGTECVRYNERSLYRVPLYLKIEYDNQL